MRTFHLPLTVGITLTLFSASLIAGEKPENIPFVPIAIPPSSNETSKDDFWLFSRSRLAPLPAAKADAVISGLTLKQLVEILGRGYMPHNSGTGTVAWYFADGRELWLSQDYGVEATNIVSFEANRLPKGYNHLDWHHQ